MSLLMSKLQRDLFEMHQSSIASICDADWKFWLLCNVNQFPLDPETQTESIQLGLCMSWQDFLHIGLWGFQYNLVMMQPPSQRSSGWATRSPSQCSSRGTTWCCSSLVRTQWQRLCCKRPLWGPGSTTQTTHTSLIGAH
jgi:hypothetical protein